MRGALVVTRTAGDPAETSSKASPVIEHCYTCVPLLLPAPVLVALPSSDPVELSFATLTLRLEDYPGLDTPPPRHPT